MSQLSKSISQNYQCSREQFERIVSHLRGINPENGSNWSVHCPAHDDQKRSASFKWEEPDRLITKCFAGCSHAEVMETLLLQGMVSQKTSRPRQNVPAEVSPTQVTQERLHALWESSKTQTAGSPVETYLTHRIPNLGFLPSCEDVRYHPALMNRETGAPLPEMVGRVRFQKSDRIAIHRTWLDPETHLKANVTSPKMMMGRVKGGAVHLRPDNPMILAIGEGIETMLSFQQMTNITSWAALSASNLGCVELPPLPQERILVIAIDNDKSDASLKAARQLQSRALSEGRMVVIVRPALNVKIPRIGANAEEKIHPKDFNDIVNQKDWTREPLSEWIEAQDDEDISWLFEKKRDSDEISRAFFERHHYVDSLAIPATPHQSFTFEAALDYIKNTRHNICLLGAGGTGKSTLIQKLVDEGGLSGHTVLLAPTGLAALNIGGETIHKFFHFSPDITPQTVRISKDKIYREIDTIIIDEVSMLRADLLDVIDIFLKKNGKSNIEPFGGVRMILCGDFFQLPPVLKEMEVQEFYASGYKTPYVFGARSFEGMECVEMNQVFRQKDEVFLNLLQKIRCSDIKPFDLAPLNARVQDPEIFLQGGLAPLLTTTNKKADAFNQEALESLEGLALAYEAKLKNWEGYPEPASKTLVLKVGAPVMFLNNDSLGRWVNGTFGVVSDLSKSNIKVKIGEVEVDVERHTWERKSTRLSKKEIQHKTEGTFTQYPLQLAWSLTIHKSQGQTFERVVIDWDRGTFADGQAYVALSRCRTLEGICLQSPTWPEHLSVSEDVLIFMETAREAPLIPTHVLSFEGTIHDQDETLYPHQEDESDIV